MNATTPKAAPRAFRHQRLDDHYDRMTAAQGDAFIERQCLNAIIVDCWALMIAPKSWLDTKDEQRRAKLLAIIDDATAGACVDSIESQGVMSFPCPTCTRRFGTAQARGAHSRFCAKGGCDA